MKVLVTGGAGFIGSHVVSHLAKHKFHVLVVDNFKTGSTDNLKGMKCSVEMCDILDFKRLETTFYHYKPEVVIHLAAQSAISTSSNYPDIDVKVNTIGTLNVIKLAKRYGAQKIVFSSTSAVYREAPEPMFSMGMTEEHPCLPTSPYGINKLASEYYIRSMFPNHAILRFGNVYGPRQKPIGENQLIARALRHFLHGDDFKVVGDGEQKRDFVFVDDVAYITCEAAKPFVTGPNLNGIYNVCTGKSYSVMTVLKELESIYKVPGYKWLHSKHQDSRGSVYLSNKKIKKALGVAFTSLEQGIAQTVEYEDPNL